jgi:hypothetical protein
MGVHIATQSFLVDCLIWMIFGIRDMHKMLFIFEIFLKISAWEAVIFLQT